VTGRGRLWRHRDFLLLWSGQSISGLGTAISMIVLPLIAVVSLHANGLQVGALTAAEWIPWLLIGLPAGVWVDRSRRRLLMIACDLVRAGLLASVPVAAAFGVLALPQLYGVAFGVGLANVVFQIAYQAYLPSVVDIHDLQEGNAKLQGTEAVARVAGPSLGGVLVQLLRAPYALIADAASYVVSALTLTAIRHREPAPEPADRQLRQEIAEGARYVAADPLLRIMTISPAIANFFFSGFEAIVVLFLVRTVHLAPASVGLLTSVVGIGSVVGATLARPIGRAVGTARALVLGIAASAPFGLLIPLTTRGPGLIFFIVGHFVMFAGILVYNVTISAFRQNYCPPQMLGRVVATMRFLLFGTIPLGGLAGGALADAIGIREAVWLLLVGNMLGAVFLVASPLRTMRDLPVRPAGLPDATLRAAHT
jgi:MFS family permease